MRSYPGFCRRKQLEYNPGLTHRRRAGHPRANRRTSDRPSFCGVRPSCSRVIMSCHIFQSTHPLRGATLRVLAIQIHPKPFQSTHPLRGATSPSRRAASLRSNFNPRTPCGVRPGCTKVNGYFWYFNPRTPCGVRPGRWAKLSTCNRFQSTHPLRGATLRVNHDFPVIQISIHAPLAGCDKKPPSTSGTPRNFNPRAPCGVRLLAFKRVFAKKNISIHAPLAGCDS